MAKKTEEIKPVEISKLEMTPEILEELLTKKLTTEDKTVNYLIDQLIAAKNQYDLILPEVKRKDEELKRLQKVLNDTAVSFETIQMLICNLWPN